MFERWIEIKESKSCLIVGPRRSGKTTLLKRFAQNTARPVKTFLFYLGSTYETVEGIRLIPVGALFRGGTF